MASMHDSLTKTRPLCISSAECRCTVPAWRRESLKWFNCLRQSSKSGRTCGSPTTKVWRASIGLRMRVIATLSSSSTSAMINCTRCRIGQITFLWSRSGFITRALTRLSVAADIHRKYSSNVASGELTWHKKTKHKWLLDCPRFSIQSLTVSRFDKNSKYSLMLIQIMLVRD